MLIVFFPFRFTHSTVNSGYLYQYENKGKVVSPVPISVTTLRFLGGGKSASRVWPAERKGGGGSRGWMVGETATFPVPRILTVTSSRAMNTSNNIHNIYYKCLSSNIHIFLTKENIHYLRQQQFALTVGKGIHNLYKTRHVWTSIH